MLYRRLDIGLTRQTNKGKGLLFNNNSSLTIE